jgi:DNA-binding FadR family transcriptional regulator
MNDLMEFVKAEGRDRRELVTDQLIAYIAANKNVAGTRLPTESELAGMFGVSRTVIRESMRSLQATGVVRIEQGRGTFVSEHPFAQPFNVWASLNVHRVTELFEVRIILEGETASRAAVRPGDKHLSELEAQLNIAQSLADAGEWLASIDSDREFHRLIARMAGLPMLEEMLQVTVPYWAQINAKFGDEANRESRVRLMVGEHRAVFEAVAAADPAGARTAMERHLRNSLERRLKVAGPG